MAGRSLGPPPFTVSGFDAIWRNWLNLVYRKIYTRFFYIYIQAIDGIGDGNPSNTMAEGLIGIAPVILAPDNKRTDQNFSSVIPHDWVPGTDLNFIITFANVQAQTGVTSIRTEINYSSTAVGEDLTLAATSVFITSTLPNNVAANILHITKLTITPQPDVEPGRQFQFELARVGNDGKDTCVGDVGYKVIAFEYRGFINPE